MKRLAIYVLWEKDGIVRDYVKVYLSGLQAVADKVKVVVNGKLSIEGRSELEKLGVDILVRENVGVDFWAYKYGMEHENDYAEKYDQVILANCSCYGPMFPFSEMFDCMEKRDLDFWGITEWPENESGYVGTWVLSYFMVFNKRIIQSIDWKEYWDNLCEVHSREECIDLHETKFTAYFADRGYKYAVYCPNTQDFIDSTIEAPDWLLKKYRCPIVKRKAFCAEYNRFLSFHRGNSSKAAFDYIKENDLYDTNIILDDLLATQHYDAVKNCLHFNYILSENQITKELTVVPKVVICFHMYYEDLLEDCVNYLCSAPDFADIYITTPKEELVPQIDTLCKKYRIKNYRIEVIPARGRAEAAFLVATKSFIRDYDYACIVHDKKSSFLKPGIIGKEFGWHNQDALLKSKQYVLNILKLFEDNPRIGMLVPFNLLYANFRELYGSEWGENYEGTCQFLKENNIDVPISHDVPPVCPMGAMFWIRPKSMNKLLDKNWEYEDFPAEPLPLDGSLIHIIERAYPYFVQAEGYLTGWVASEKDAEVYVTDIAFLYRTAKGELRKRTDLENLYNSSLHEIQHLHEEMELKDQALDAAIHRLPNLKDYLYSVKERAKRVLGIGQK